MCSRVSKYARCCKRRPNGIRWRKRRDQFWMTAHAKIVVNCFPGMLYRPPGESLSLAQLPGAESALTNYEREFMNRMSSSEFDFVSRISASRRQPLYAAADGVRQRPYFGCALRTSRRRWT
jgi:hypothetical protein